MRLVYLNGKFVDKNKAKISPFDRGFLYGDGVFETLRTYNYRYFCLDEHIDRLFASAGILKIKIGKTKNQLKETLQRFLKKNKITDTNKDYRVRITVSRGEKKPTIFIFGQPLIEKSPSFFEKGVDIIIAKTRRNAINSLTPLAKTTNFLNNILAGFEKERTGTYEAIMLSQEGYIAEGTISNIFWVKKGILYTPSIEVGILPGITRSVVIELAKRLKIKVREGKFKKEVLKTATEIFLTGTSYGIIPVKAMGPVTRLLRTAFLEKI